MTRAQQRIGILGAGFISNYHIDGLRQAGAEVAAIYSRRAASAQAKAEQFGIPDWTTDEEALLQRDDLDAVIIATPDFMHEPHALAAIRAGKPALLQKPMARTSAECRRIIDAANAAGVPLYVSFMHRYFPEVAQARVYLEQGLIGQIYTARLRSATPGADWNAWFYSREQVGGGAVMQIGIHGIDLLRHLFGEIEAVRATTALLKTPRTLADGSSIIPDNEDTMFATYWLSGGVLASHEVSYNEVAGTDRFRLEIYGEKGTLWLRTERGRLAFCLSGQSGEWALPELPPPDFALRQHRHFLDMLSSAAPPDDSARAGLASVLVAEAIYRSSEHGAWENIESLR